MLLESGKLQHSIGDSGEQYAVDYLKSKDYEILQRNFRIRTPVTGEVDIIARTGEYLVFFEIKTRKQGGLTPAPFSVTAAQKKRILAAAQAFLYRYPLDLQPRFDVICLETAKGTEFRVLSLEHYEDAFWLE